MSKSRDHAGSGGRSAYWLIAALAVLVVAALMWAVIGFFVGGAEVTNQNESNQLVAGLTSLQAALVRYQSQHGEYPTTEQGLEALAEKPELPPVPENWEALMLRQGLDDPWGNFYHYRRLKAKDPEATSFDLWSIGKDGINGTADDIHRKR